MRKRTSLLLVLAGVMGVAWTAVATSDAAAARSATAVIGPRQPFVGLVNGHAADAVIAMVCTSPLEPGQTGHPIEGQTLSVEPPPTTAGTAGNTGTRGRSVIATFVVPSAAATSTVTSPTTVAAHPRHLHPSLRRFGLGRLLSPPDEQDRPQRHRGRHLRQHHRRCTGVAPVAPGDGTPVPHRQGDEPGQRHHLHPAPVGST